MVTD
ncbi:hypothetical protein CP061683_0634, partial [Chlamydia psittaci 06-1683]